MTAIIICLWINLTLTMSQRVTIWSSEFTTDTEGWLIDGKVSIESDSRCPDESSCLELRPWAEVWRYDSTIGYTDLYLKLSLQSSGMTGGQSCDFWYIAGKESNDWSEWTLFHSVSNTDATTYNFEIPPELDDNEIAGFSFVAVPGSSGSPGYCRLNNVALTGISSETTTTTTTSSPTRSPTRSPTDVPSRDPTNVPTQSPTLSPTNSPSLFPTYYHSMIPSVKPTRAPYTQSDCK